MKKLLFLLIILTLPLLPPAAFAQVIWSSATGTAWMTGSNWTGGAIPGATAIAQFNGNPTSSVAGIGIDMDTASSALSVGAIYVSTARTNNIFFGNSAPTTPGVISFTGATVTVPNVVLANFAANNAKLTLQNTQGAGGSTLGLNITGSNAVMLAGAGSATGIGNTIAINSVLAGAGAISFLGSGTWDATTATGNNGGILKLGAANTTTGGIAIGNSDGTANGILELDLATAMNNVAGNNIAVNPNSQLYLAVPSGANFSTNNFTTFLNGLGNNYSVTGKGAMATLSGNAYTWSGDINLPTDAAIAVLGTAGSLGISGNIRGGGQLIKTGTGNLILSGTANSWVGGTMVNSGRITVNAGSALSTGTLAMSQTAGSASVVLNNSTQTITGLSSSFTTSSVSNTITLNGTRLTLNLAGYNEFGGPSATQVSTISGSGSVVKTGAGTLKLTSAGNNFSGGLTISAGVILLNPTNGTTANNTSPDTLNGGAFSSDSISRTFTYNFGTLALTENSTIDLGSDTMHFIRFTTSNAITWTSGKTLLITHWVGNYNGTAGTRGRLYFGTTATGLTAAQLAQINFTDNSGNTYFATQLSTGEVVPAAPVITTTAATYGPYCSNVASTFNVAFTTLGPLSAAFKVQLSGPTGVFPIDFTSSIIGSGSISPITATIPSGTTAGTGYRVRVINPGPTPTFGSNNGSNITLIGAPAVAAISGAAAIANGGTANYTDATAGGTWAVTGTTVATVNATGTVTALSIGSDTLVYSVTNSCGITGTASKVITVVAIPAITNLSPVQGLTGSAVTITGVHFNAVPAQNIVFFGATRAAVTGGSTTSLTVTVPVNASYGPVTVTDSLSGFTAISQETFTPVYATSGLTPNSVNFKPMIAYTTGATPVGVALGDLDGDGKPDVVVTNSGPNSISIFKNVSASATISSTTFSSPITLATASGPHYLKIADLDGDGRLDIIVANTSTSSNKISIFRNTSTGSGISFATRVDLATGGAAPIDVCVADFDMDGRPDIAIVNQSSSKIGILKNLSSPGVITTASFATAVTFTTGLTPFKLFAGDMDNDGYPDLAVTNFSANTVSLFHNNITVGTISASTFSLTTTLSGVNSPTGIAGGDIDGDGKPELVICNSAGASISVFQNTNTTAGSISFGANVDFVAGSAPADLVVGDINGDGKTDIAVGNYTANSISIFRNTATSGTISSSSLASHVQYATGTSPSGIALTDIDGDGKADISIANGGSSSVSFLKNYPLPTIGSITGADSICVGSVVTLGNSVSGGTWLSTNPAVATVNSTGSVTTLTPGLDTILYYTVAQGDTSYVAHEFTVDAHLIVSPISQPINNLCIGALMALTDSVASGIWTSSDSNIAHVDPAGYVSGRTVGSAIITYSITNTCGSSQDTVAVRVNPSSGYVIGLINGLHALCTGSVTTYTDTTAAGTWTSNEPSVATVSASGVVKGLSVGTAIITYGFAGGCGTYIDTQAITIDTILHADSISGPAFLCPGDIIPYLDAAGTGGVWSVVNSNASVASNGMLTALATGVDTLRYTIANTCGSSTGTKVITIGALPYAGHITGPTNVCPADTIFLADTTAGGVWLATNLKGVLSATGRFIGTFAGIDTVQYIFTNSCGSDTARSPITILPLPNAGTLTGASSVCVGTSITLHNTIAGGTWTSINTNASVADSVITGLMPGTDSIIYTLTTTCGTAVAIKKITVYAFPTVDTIAGPSVLCTGASVALTNATSGGFWTKTNNHLSLTTGGIATGISPGLDTVKYTITTNGCASVASKQINVLPSTAGAIISPASLCAGTSVTLRDTIPGGVWSSTSHATLLTDSVLTGIKAGIDTIKYTVTSSCGTVFITKKITINPAPDAGNISGLNEVAISDTIILKSSVTGGYWQASTGNTVISAIGVLGGLKEGKDTILYIVTNTCGKDTAYFPILISPTKKPGTITDITLYPNPNNGSFQFNVLSKIDEPVTIVVANSVYQAFSLFTTTSNTLSSMQLDNVANGVYFLSAITSQGWHTIKFVIAR